MDQKMTYKQALVRSLIVGGIFSAYTFLFTLDIVSLGRVTRVASLLIYECGMWLIMLLDVIDLRFYYEGIAFIVSPLIICLLLGYIVFLTLRNKTQVIPKRFTLILILAYLAFNVASLVVFHKVS